MRRAYKRLALQLHPDKAAAAVRLAPRCCGCGTAAYESVAAQERLAERATWLFKLLGEFIGGGGLNAVAVAGLQEGSVDWAWPPLQPRPLPLPPPLYCTGEANEVLCDAGKRRELDHALRMAAAGGGAPGGGFTSYYGRRAPGGAAAGQAGRGANTVRAAL